MTQVIDYAVAGPFTALDEFSPAAFEPVVGDPVKICFPVHNLVIQPTDAESLKLPSERFAASQIRPHQCSRR